MSYMSRQRKKARPKMGDVDKDGWVCVAPRSATTFTPLWLFMENTGVMSFSIFDKEWHFPVNATSKEDKKAKFACNMKDFHGHKGSRQQTLEKIRIAALDDGGARRFTKEEGIQLEKFLRVFPTRRAELLDKCGPTLQVMPHIDDNYITIQNIEHDYLDSTGVGYVQMNTVMVRTESRRQPV